MQDTERGVVELSKADCGKHAHAEMDVNDCVWPACGNCNHRSWVVVLFKGSVYWKWLEKGRICLKVTLKMKIKPIYFYVQLKVDPQVRTVPFCEQG